MRLPPYSLYSNRFESALAKLKALLRKVAARIKEAFWQTIGELLEYRQSGPFRVSLESAGGLLSGHRKKNGTRFHITSDSGTKCAKTPTRACAVRCNPQVPVFSP